MIGSSASSGGVIGRGGWALPLLQKVDEDGGLGVVKGEVTRGLMGSAVEAIMKMQSAFWAKPGTRVYLYLRVQAV